jgi:hypothetical protein
MFRLRQGLILALNFSSGPLDEPRTAIHSLAPTLLQGCHSHAEVGSNSSCGLIVDVSGRHLAPRSLWRLHFSSDCHSPAPRILWRLHFSGDYISPATAILQRLPFSSASHSPATAILQHLPFFSDYYSPALHRLGFKPTMTA